MNCYVITEITNVFNKITYIWHTGLAAAIFDRHNKQNIYNKYGWHIVVIKNFKFLQGGSFFTGALCPLFIYGK